MKPDYSSPDSSENRPLRLLVESVVGGIRAIDDVSRSFGRRSVNWRVTTVDGRAVYLKRHQHKSHYHWECVALGEWVPQLPRAEWWTAPKLLGRSDELGAIVISELDGAVSENMATAGSRTREIYELAGRFAAALHGSLSAGTPPGRPRNYDEATIFGLLDPARAHLNPDTTRWLERLLLGDHLWSGLSLVRVHADFSPRNWVVTERANVLGVIDWERCRPGFWVEDFQRMIYDEWQSRPDYADAFFAGYGRKPTQAEWHQARLVALINAVGGVPWAVDHGDTQFARFCLGLIETFRKRASDFPG